MSEPARSKSNKSNTPRARDTEAAPEESKSTTTEQAIPVATFRKRPPRHQGGRMTAKERKLRQEAYLEAYAKSGISQAGLDAAGITRWTLKRWRDNDPVFLAAYEEAAEDANDVIRSRIYHLGVVGIKRSRLRYWKGELIAEETWVEYDTAALLALARARMPEFRQGYKGQDGELGPDAGKLIINLDIEKV